jgi:Ca2+:H+ antiporter
MRYLNLAGYVAIPLAYLVHFWLGQGAGWEPVATFVLASLGVIPLAHLMGEATEHLAERTGPTWGGLLNATFGNAAELIIAIIALTKGFNDVVKASLTGSILGNLLLVGGAAMLIGGWRLLVLAVAAMLFPAIFHFTAERLHDVQIVEHEHRVSIGTSVILLIVYGLGLLFTLRTHAHIFSPAAPRSEEDPQGIEGHEQWSVKKSVIMLLLASLGIGLVAELLVGAAEKVAHTFGWNPIFVGVILLAIIGNAAEHSTAVMLAKRNDMDTAMTICYQSSLQIALFATPFLVLLSSLMIATGMGMGGVPVDQRRALDLIFTPMEVVSVLLTMLIIVVIGLNGETNWFEGVLLLALYVILGIAFFYIPVAAGHG